ncbi:unnamed protein product [Adineta ricciae]|uniref:Rhamnogalacturonase A/B/Epimerase-like pectate lyase domain-containing protein n=1 Tax=Adineta ricciae TaxID=249248 RepID=A0A814YBW9_ADIRI|nr:unnamed protein product [Adineta ricciae]CAF1228288.1 unnamed protein product [Adineta ricciae]
MSAVYLGTNPLRDLFILFIILIQYSYTEEFNIPVSNFGAYPNDNIDDTNAIQNAIGAAIFNGTNNTVTLQSGTYDLSAPIYIYQANGFSFIGQGMDQTLLLVHSSISLFYVINSQQVILTLFSIDFSPLPFTAGYVVKATSSYLDLQVVAPHQADVGRKVGAIFRYDPVLKKPAIGNRSYEIYQTPPANQNTTLNSNGTLRIYLQYQTQFTVGDPIVARYSFTTHAIYAQDTIDLTIQSLTIYTAWYFGIYTSRARRLNMIDYHVRKRGDRWLSTAADCMHFGDSRESINIMDCSCEGQGDDGLNVQAFIFVVVQVINSTTLLIKTNNWEDALNVGIGSNLEFSAGSQPFTSYTSAIVATSTSINSTTRLFTFTNVVSVNVGDLACVADNLTLTVRNFTVTNNRARGILLSTRNIRITKSLFNGTSAPAILFQPSLYWNEGPAPKNAILSENVFINCNQGLYRQSGVITMAPEPTQVLSVMHNIQVTSSTFYNGPYSGSMVQCTNVDGIVITGNYLSTNSSDPPVVFCNSRNISASDNTIVNSQSVISQYYLYDTTSPCLANLSSIINITASGFNSSFPPPVIPTSTGVQLNTNQITSTATMTTSTSTATMTTSTSTATMTTSTSTATMTTGTSSATSTSTVGNHSISSNSINSATLPTITMWHIVIFAMYPANAML